MKEETKQRLKQIGYFAMATIAGGVLTLLTMGVVGCALRNQANTDTTSLKTKKELQNGQSYTINATSNTWQVWKNGYVNTTFNSTYAGTWTGNVSFKTANNDWFLVSSVGMGNSDLSPATQTYTIEATNTATNYYFTAVNAPTIEVINDFLPATGETLTALNEDLETLFRLEGGESTTISVSDFVGYTVLHSPAEYFYARAYYNNEWHTLNAEADRNWTFSLSEWETLRYTKLKFSPSQESVILWNKTLNHIYFDTNPNSQQAFEDLESGWQVLAPGERATIYKGSTLNLYTNQIMQIDYNGNNYDPNYMWEGANSPLAGKYYATIQGLQHDLTTIAYNAQAPEQADETLYQTFSIIATAFSSIIPILELKVFANITIGLLLLIPFTFAIMTLLFKLIKK